LRHHNGNRAGRLLGSTARLGPHRDQDIDPELDQLRDEVGEPLVSALLPAIRNGNGLALDVAALAQALAEGFGIRAGRITEKANPGDLPRRLGCGGERRHKDDEGKQDEEAHGPALHRDLRKVSCRETGAQGMEASVERGRGGVNAAGVACV